MPYSYGAEDVKCPFYKIETKNSIKCEGFFCESCVHDFKTAKKKKKHKELYCNADYKSCPHFVDVNSKY